MRAALDTAAESIAKVRVRLTNTGNRASDETPQLYIRPRVSSTVAARRLQGYRRVSLRAGQSTTVEFKVPSSRLAIAWSSSRACMK